MKIFKFAAAVVVFVGLTACATITDTLEGSNGISATDCFAAGGTIEDSMCVMSEGDPKPII